MLRKPITQEAPELDPKEPVTLEQFQGVVKILENKIESIIAEFGASMVEVLCEARK